MCDIVALRVSDCVSMARIALMAALLALAFPAAASAFDAHGSARQVYVTGLTPGAPTVLLEPGGKTVTRAADPQGGLLFRNLKPGSGYQVRSGGAASPPLTVLSDQAAPPDTGVYGQSIPSDGYGYLTTRDGTKLAINVHPPQDVADALPANVPLPPLPKLPGGVGATPTLIEYSGYGYADPAGPQSGIAVIANLMGFTVVDVNMRGTGCSGGAFDFFEPLQGLDGYDVIETIARQPWVAHHKVGMMGISYGGISQLFTAQMRPPSLAAISPLSVIDQTQTTLYPGGVLNTGFAVAWAKERQDEAKPAGPNSGQPYAWEQIQKGDQTCKANQTLHGEAANLMAKIRRNNHYRPKVADPLSPITFVHKIHIPVFMACQWTDEQTGGHCPTLAEHMTGTRRKWFTFTNGTHVDSLDPETFNRWYDFLQLFVAKQKPELTAGQKAVAPTIYQSVMGVSGVHLPPDPIQQKPDYDSALAAFDQTPSVRVLFDNGAGGDQPGAPLEGFRHSFHRFPPPKTHARSWFLGNDGALSHAKGSKSGAESFQWDPTARPPTDFTGDTGSGGLWTATPDYHWSLSPAGHALSYVSKPLRSDTAVIGAGALKAWIQAAAPSVDLQVTVSEVRPDDKETFVQSGWLRTSERKLDKKKSTRLEPVPSFRKSDAAPLPKGKWAKVTVPLYYEGHMYRKGSRIRVTIAAPGGDQRG